MPEITEKGYELFFYQVDRTDEVSEYGAIFFVYHDQERDEEMVVRFAMDNYYEHCLAVELDPRMQVEGCMCVDPGWMAKQLLCVKENLLPDNRKGIKGMSQRALANTKLDFAEEYISDGCKLQQYLRPGRLIIVDLRDEFIEKEEALGLFVVMLNIFSSVMMAALGSGEAYLWANKATDKAITQRPIKISIRPRVTRMTSVNNDFILRIRNR